MKISYKSDVGLMRKNNQDYIFACDSPVGSLPNLMIVADGMGGHKAGDYASRVAIETLTESIRHSSYKNPLLIVTDAVRRANRTIYEASVHEEQYQGMGTTMTLAWTDPTELHVFHIGDSRLYLFSRKTLRQLTEDHSYVEEMVRKGLMERGSLEYLQKKNIVTRALGGNDFIASDIYEEELLPGDVILMCSDGLTNMVPDAQIAEVLLENTELEEKTQKLIQLANQNGGQDNISVILSVVD